MILCLYSKDSRSFNMIQLLRHKKARAFLCVLYLGIFVCFRFLLSNGFRLKKDSRLSQDSYLYINLISIMKNNSYSVHARLHDCSLSKRAMGISIALIYRDLCFRMERFHQHLEAFANEKKPILYFAGSLILLNFVGEEGFFIPLVYLLLRDIFFSP